MIIEDQNKVIIELAQKELIEAISTYRTQYTLLTQAISVIIVGNITVIGWGFSNQKSGIILLGCIFPILMHYLYRAFHRMNVPVVYTAIQFENILGTNKYDWLATTYLYRRLDLLDELRKVCLIENQIERFKKLNKISTKPVNIFNSRLTLLTFIAFTVQLVLAVFLSKFLCWSLL
jgi:hypothetical protein